MLNVLNSLISADQIQKLNVSSHVNITGSYIDFTNLHLLTTNIINLTIEDCQVNVSLLSGNFTSVTFRTCKIIQTATNFKSNSVSINQCSFSAESIESLDCETLSIFASGNEQLIQLPLKSKAIRKTADLRGCILDLCGVAGNWTELACYDCFLKRINNVDDTQYQLNKTNQINNIKECELGSQQAKIKLTLNQSQLQDLNQLSGQWHYIWLDTCTFLSPQLPDHQIVSGIIYIQNVNINDFSCFQASHIRIFKCTVKNIPQNSVLDLNNCNIQLDSKLPKINSITLCDCRIFKFRVLNFPIKSISFRGKHYGYQYILEEFKKSYNTNKHKKWNMNKSVKQEQKRISIKQTLVQNIFICNSKMLTTIQQLLISSE
ncbi:Hypothetical_protein [Hexamita inflata]|uniref:Hypothetical_protein n=1 Tax=Hexamita inflata TaxID=28002 RepID=A0AA86PKM1_9EUKA|nr:Hypothetical protein HINF_LOCUS28641 [Hexamita inflata]